MNNYTIIIPNRFYDIIQPLIRSLRIYEQELSKVVIIADGHDCAYGYKMIKTEGDFVYSKAINLGIKAAGLDDVILLNDDVRLTEFDTFKILQKMAYSKPRIGILSPLVDGGCGNVWMKVDRTDLWESNTLGIHFCKGLRGPDRVTFSCVYIKRALINKIGLMDEKFTGYGFDDADFCIRTVQTNWEIAITNRTKIQHGEGGSDFIRGKNWNSSFMRNRIGGTRRNLDYLMTKHPEVFKDNSKFERTNVILSHNT